MRSDLELFVLALVKQGLTTKYELRERAGMSLGSTSPVLDRLREEGLITASEEGARGSVRFSVTAKGANVLKQQVASLLSSRPRDIDSILRITYLAWLNGDTEDLANFMNKSADALHGLAESRRAEAGRLNHALGETPDGDAFRWLRTHCEAARVQAEADALLDLSSQMSEKRKKRNHESAQRRRRARS